jgi:uncharacterized protein DUF3800
VIIYLDESYDWQGTYFLLGALFVRENHDVFLSSFNDIKREEKFARPDGTLRELKYSKINHDNHERAAVKAIQAFKAQNAYFRAVVIPQAAFDLTFYGKKYEPENIKRARAYKKFAEMLIEYNAPELADGVLFADYLSRCKGALGKGDEFIEAMKQRFLYPTDEGLSVKSKLRHISEVPSDHEKYALLQVCDVLLGSTLNGVLKIAKGARMAHKNTVTEKMKEILEFPTFDKSYWQSVEKLYIREYKERLTMEDYCKRAHHKYRLWFWKPKQKA